VLLAHHPHQSKAVVVDEAATITTTPNPESSDTPTVLSVAIPKVNTNVASETANEKGRIARSNTRHGNVLPSDSTWGRLDQKPMLKTPSSLDAT
jgi:hypothetical protein